MNINHILLPTTFIFVFTQWTCSQRDGEQTRTPETKQKQEKVLPRSNTQEGYIARDSRVNVERFLNEYKRTQKDLDSIIVPAHVSIGQFLNRGRLIQGYFVNSDLTLYEQPDSNFSIAFRDTAYKWSGNAKGSGDGYLVRSQWNILEYTPQWIKVRYKDTVGWLSGKYFAAHKIVLFDMSGNIFREFLSPFIGSGIYTVVAGEDSLSFYVSNYKDFYLRIDFLSGRVIDTVRASYLIEHHLLKESYIRTQLNMPEEDFVLLEKMQFDPGTFRGRFLQDRVMYIYKNTEFNNSLLSENYETGKVDTLFSFNRIQQGIAYLVESVCPLGNQYIVMTFNAYDARY